MWLKRAAREWVVIVSAFVGAAFMAADGVGWLDYIFNWKPDKIWVYIGVFVVFAIVVLIRLVKLQSTIDEIKGYINFTATPTTFLINYPLPSELPLEKDEVSLYTSIQFQVWTTIDINTSRLFLNIVAFRNLHVGWKIWKPFGVKRIIGIPMIGNEDSTYCKKIRCSDEQPFKGTATFKWRGKIEDIIWGNEHIPELALELGIPKRILRVYLDDPLFKKRIKPTPL